MDSSKNAHKCTQLDDSSTNQHVLNSPSRRLQNIWSAVKRLSTSSTNKSGANNVVEKAPTGIKFWSPFAKRKHPECLNNTMYSSHPNILKAQYECRQAGIGMERSPLSNNRNPTNRWKNTKHLSSSIGSPMKKIRKISENMQKCVHRTVSNDHDDTDHGDDDNDDDDDEDIVQFDISASNKNDKDDTYITASGEHQQAVQNHCHDIDLDNRHHHQEESAKMRACSQRLSNDSPFHQLDVHLKYAENLIAKDSCGTSDPYVKFKIGDNIVKKSRTIQKDLNPVWDEYFVLPINDIYEPLVLRVYDYDLFSADDFLGTVCIDLLKLNLSISTEIELYLQEDQDIITYDDCMKDRQLGKIFLTLKLVPKTLQEKENYYGRQFQASAADNQAAKRTKIQPFENVVNILLIDGDNFELDTDYMIRFKLGNEKAKSRTMPKTTKNPSWIEQFDLNMFVGQSKMLEICVCGTNHSLNEYYHKLRVDLSELINDQTQRIVKTFGQHDNLSTINILLTISGACSNQLSSKSLAQIHHDLKSQQTLRDMSHVGNLVLKVHKAESLAAADMNGKSDPFCVVELSNQRVRTCTQYKSLSPEWDNVFAFKFDDIHSILEVTVFDEDRDGAEFLGKIGIPLLKINNREKKWFALKDKKLQARVKGHILLEFMISYDKIKASLRTFTPREKKLIVPDLKFKRSLFIRNTNRLKCIIMQIYQVGRFMNSCIKWEYPLRSLVSFVVFIVFVYYCELYMFPLLGMLMLLINYFRQRSTLYFNDDSKIDEYIDENAVQDFDDDKAEDKKSLKERLQTVQEISAVIMNVLGQIASFFERLKNACNFSVPFLSWLAVIGLLIITCVLYWIPLRYLIIVWGINKFTKKFRSPNTIDNNEFLDFLSRIPDSEEKIMYKQFRPNIQNEVQTMPANSTSLSGVTQTSSSSSSPSSLPGVSSTTNNSNTGRHQRPLLKKNSSIQSDRSINSECSTPVTRQRLI